jgi:hypothetical protein
LTISGFTLTPDPAQFISFTGTVTDDSIGASYGPTPLGGASYTGPVTGAFGLDIGFSLTSAATGLALTYGVPLSSIPDLSLSLWKGNTEITPTLDESSSGFLVLDYTGLSAGSYTLEVAGAAPGVGTTYTFNGSVGVTAVPVPAAVLLFGSGLAGLVGFGRLKRNKGEDAGIAA